MKRKILLILFLFATNVVFAQEKFENISGRHEKGRVLIRRPNEKDVYAQSLLVHRGEYISERVLSDEEAKRKFGVRSLSIITFKSGSRIVNLETFLREKDLLTSSTKEYPIKVNYQHLTEKMVEIAVYPPAIVSVKIAVDPSTGQKFFDIRTVKNPHIDKGPIKVNNVPHFDKWRFISPR